MTDETTNQDAPAEQEIADPAERAKANGYVEPEVPSREERAGKAIAELEHAVRHNAPISRLTLAEIKELLGVPDKPEEPAVDAEPADDDEYVG